MHQFLASKMCEPWLRQICMLAYFQLTPVTRHPTPDSASCRRGEGSVAPSSPLQLALAGEIKWPEKKGSTQMLLTQDGQYKN